MPKYRLLSAAVIDGELMEAGREIEFDGTPGRHMEPLDTAAKKMEVPGPAPLDPLYLAYAREKAPAGRALVGDVVMTGFYGFPVGSAPAVVDVPHVAGDGTVGEILTCTMGNWTGEPTGYAYLWESDGTDVGTDDGSYLIDATDAGHSITCAVTASNAWGSTTAPPSNAVAVAASRKTGGSRHG